MRKLKLYLYQIVPQLPAFFYRTFYKMDLAKNVYLSRKARLDLHINPKGIHVGEHTYITAGCVILAHDASRRIKRDTYIGKNCFIGVNSIILPGVKIGNNVVIGAGSVVTKDIPDFCIAAGNPARVIKENVNIGPCGHIIG